MQFFAPDEMGPVIDEVVEASEVLLFGRRTWQTMAAAWPERAGDPFADRLNEMPKYVASRTLSQADLHWSNSTLLPPDDVLGGVQRLRRQEGGDILVMGSPTLCSFLIANDLVDEYRLMIEPIVLGGGKRIFPDDGRARTIELISSSTTTTGVHICTYSPAR